MLRTGVDIVHIPRIARLLGNPAALRRMLHDAELGRMDAEHLAGVIAAKEAFFKCFETAPRWHDIEVRPKPNGKPILLLSTELEEQVAELDLSISHDEDYAIAQVVLRRR